MVPLEIINSASVEIFKTKIHTTAQSHSTKPELRFSAGPNAFCGVWEIRDGEDLWQSSRLDIRLNSFCRSTVPHKQIIVNNLGFVNIK